jgi:hypothetical protein
MKCFLRARRTSVFCALFDSMLTWPHLGTLGGPQKEAFNGEFGHLVHCHAARVKM